MTNIRKQTIVISVLIVLIACAGLFARNFNETLTDNALSSQATETNKTLNYFVDSRMQKESIFDTSIAEFKELRDNKGLSQKARETASLKLINMVSNHKTENTIETLIKGRGFEDALCMLSDKNAEVFVKTKEQLTAAQVHDITKIILNNSKITPSNIFIKSKN
jgi:stage III sporulation protein AH